MVQGAQKNRSPLSLTEKVKKETSNHRGETGFGIRLGKVTS